jgi:hypothetical protein
VEELDAELLEEEPDGEGGAALRVNVGRRPPVLRHLHRTLLFVEVQLKPGFLLTIFSESTAP